MTKEFAPNTEIQKLSLEAQEFYKKVLHDEKPLFVSDEATIWDVSMSAENELLKRCSNIYGKSLSADDLKQPLWKLLRQLNEKR